LTQNIIRYAESIVETNVFIDDLQKPVVGNDDQRVSVLFKRHRALLGGFGTV